MEGASFAIPESSGWRRLNRRTSFATPQGGVEERSAADDNKARANPKNS
jgi:hypothetical protein